MKKIFLIIAGVILMTTDGNCQWYQTWYGVNEINQLSTEQLNNALRITNRHIQTGKIISVIGAIGIIGSIIEMNATNHVEAGYSILLGAAGIIISVPLEITGLTIWGVNSSRKNKIVNCLRTAKIGIGFNHAPAITMFENSNFNLTPAIAVVISF